MLPWMIALGCGEVRGMGPEAKKCLRPPGTGRDRKDSPLGALVGPQPADTVTPDFWPQNCQKIKICCFKPLGWWHFVTVAPGDT